MLLGQPQCRHCGVLEGDWYAPYASSLNSLSPSFRLSPADIHSMGTAVTSGPCVRCACVSQGQEVHERARPCRARSLCSVKIQRPRPLQQVLLGLQAEGALWCVRPFICISRMSAHLHALPAFVPGVSRAGPKCHGSGHVMTFFSTTFASPCCYKCGQHEGCVWLPFNAPGMPALYLFRSR